MNDPGSDQYQYQQQHQQQQNSGLHNPASTEVGAPGYSGNASATGQEGPPSAVFVSNLQWWTTDVELEAMCSEYGTVTGIKFIEDKSCGKSRGMAVVDFESQSSVQACIDGMNGKEINGRPCKVTRQMQQPHRHAGPVMGGPGRGMGGRGMMGRGGRGGVQDSSMMMPPTGPMDPSMMGGGWGMPPHMMAPGMGMPRPQQMGYRPPPPPK